MKPDRKLNDDQIQLTTVRHRNSCIYNFDARSVNANFNPNNSLITNIDGPTQAFTKNVRRWAVRYFGYMDVIPNVNDRTDQVSFQYLLGGGGPGVSITVNLTRGNYGVNDQGSTVGNNYIFQNRGRAALITEIVAQMNAATAALTFIFTGDINQGGGDSGSANLDNALNGSISLNPVGPDPTGTFHFITTRFMERQRWLWGPQLEGPTPVPAGSKRYGPVLLFYTRYFDIRSNVLTQDMHVPNYTTDDGATNNILRVYTQTQNTLGRRYGDLIQFSIQEPRWCNVRSDRHLTNIDIQIIDEWNEILTLPEPTGDFQGSNFAWMMDLHMEL